MAVVSSSFSVAYPVRARVSSDPLEIDHSVRVVIVGSGVEVDYRVKLAVSKAVSLVHSVRRVMSPGRVFTVQHSVRERVSKSQTTLYGVRVPVSSPKTFDVDYDVRSRVSTDSGLDGSFSSAFSTAFNSEPAEGITIIYNTGVTGATMVSKTVQIVYHTLIKPTVDEVITVPIERDAVPPQVITTTSF